MMKKKNFVLLPIIYCFISFELHRLGVDSFTDAPVGVLMSP